MTRDEADALAADLRRAGVYVDGVEPRAPHAYYKDLDEWQVRAWCDDPPRWYTVSDAARFRQAVRDGLVPELPRNALG